MAASSGKNDSTRVGKMSTKELARSLGLIRKLSASTKKSEAIRLKKQPFTYLVVIDFESTCWKDKRMSCDNEIIEFPAVLMHTSTGAIESEFHQYVQPSEHPRLSDFCKELTGINQSQVDDGIPIGTCLMLFNIWLKEICQKKNIKFLSQVLKATEMERNPETDVKWGTFVTWSDWDIGICLKNECQRKRHLVPQPLRSWIDLRETYKTFYSRKPKGLAGAMTDLGIQFTGRQHSGLDDARNTARLAWRMTKDGCVMNVTSSIDASVSVLHQIIQNGFKENDPPKKPMKSILQLIEAQKVCETSHENQSSKAIQSNACTSVLAGDDCKVENLKLKTNLETRDFVKNISICKKESRESRAVSWENQTRDSISHSVQSLLVPPVSVSDFTFTVDAATNKPGGTKTLVSPITALTGLTCLAGQCSSESRQGSESAAHSSSSNLLKRKLTNWVDSPIGAKRGLAKQTLGMRLPTKSAGLFRDGSLVKPLVVSPRVHCSASKSNGTDPMHLCKSSNLPGFKSQTPRLVDRTNLVSNHTFKVSSQGRATGSAEKSVVKSFTKCQQDGTKIAENVEKENRIKGVEPGDGVFKTPMPVSSRKGHSRSSTKATVMPTSFKSPVTPLTSGNVTPPVLRFNGGSVTPPLCDCGRRARRLTVRKPGPNQGRVFYACSVRNNRSSFGKSPVKSTKGQKNCHFFCWEPMGTQMSPFQRTLQRRKVNGAQSIQLSFIDKP